MSELDVREVKLQLRYPESRQEDITDAYMRGYKSVIQVTDKLITRLNEENAKLRELAGGIGYLLFSLDVDYCVACPRDTINHPCPVHTLKVGECLYKTDLRELGVEL